MLENSRSRSEVDVLVEEIRHEIRKLHAEEPRCKSTALKSQWDNLITPGLALYRALSAEGNKDRQAVLDEVEGLFQAMFFMPERRMVRLLNLLPNPFPLVRIALRRMTQNEYRPGATEIVEDSPDCFAVNTYSCFILDTLTALGAPELTQLYCKTDDWLAAEVPKVQWLRTKTLANGDAYCDFRWCRKGARI